MFDKKRITLKQARENSIKIMEELETRRNEVNNYDMIKTTKYHFKKNDEVTTIESNEISARNTFVKFKNEFYKVESGYQEILEDGRSIYHHDCIIKGD